MQKASQCVIDFIRTIISGAASDEDLQKRVLVKTIESNFDLAVCNKPEAQILALEVLEIRNRAGCCNFDYERCHVSTQEEEDVDIRYEGI